MTVKKLLSDIIPPNDHQHRNGFSNLHIIDKLNQQERDLVEDALIKKVISNSDMLIVETLGYMKPYKSLPVLIELLKQTSDPISKIIISTAIFEINHDDAMIKTGADAFRKLNSIYQKIEGFYYLKKFQNTTTDEMIREYISSTDYLLSYNAKRALEG